MIFITNHVILSILKINYPSDIKKINYPSANKIAVEFCLPSLNDKLFRSIMACRFRLGGTTTRLFPVNFSVVSKSCQVFV